MPEYISHRAPVTFADRRQVFIMSCPLNPRPWNAQNGLCYLSLLLLGWLAFGRTTAFDFVNWDDPAYIHHNPAIQGWSLSNLQAVATATVTRNYAPLTIFSLLLDHTFTGLEPAGYHRTNVWLHLLNGVLVFVLICRLTGSRFVGWATAALFLVHPVQIETVAWISSRKGLLSATFMLAALIVRLRPDLQPRHDGWYIGLLLAALLSKALAVVVPPLVLLYDLLIRREKFSDAVVRQVIPGLLSLLLLLYTMGAQHSILGGVRGHMQLSLLQILAVDVTILWRYVGLLVWPADLCVLYDPPTSGIAVEVALGLVGWIAIVSAVWFSRQRHPLGLFSLGSCLLLLFPVLNFFRITTLMNDRYLYLPCVCVFAPAAAALQWLAGQAVRQLPTLRIRPAVTLRSAQLLSSSVLGIVLLLLLRQTHAHLPVWTNAESLWRHALQEVSQLPVVRIQWALTLHDTGRVREAVEVLRQARQEVVADAADRERMERHIADWTRELNEVATVEIQP